MKEAHPYSDKLPELNQSPLSDWICNYVYFYNLKESEKEYMVAYLFGKLALAFGGYSHFWQDDAEKEFIKKGWKEFLGDLNIRTILSGLYSILKGNTQYLTKPPRAPMEFYHLCKTASPMTEFYNPLQLTHAEKLPNKERAEKSIKNIREILSRWKIKANVKDNE